MTSGPNPLANPTYRRLFAAQVIALVGTGVSGVALGLLAYDLAGKDAGVVLGVALALKMVAYVALSPLIAAYAHRAPRRGLLVALDLLRAAVVFVMPFVTELWQVYVLILLLSAAAAGFTPALQATIPDVLRDERAYTRALSLSRMAYDLEELLSPALAVALLLFVDFSALFAVNGVAFLASAALVVTVALPVRRTGALSERSWERITYGTRQFLRTPRLRALLALNLAVACASAMTIVNTVVLVRDRFDASQSAVAVALCAAGVGSIATALALPRLLVHRPDRTLMLAGGALIPIGLAMVSILPSYAALLAVWSALGIGLSLVLTPAGRLIQRSGDEHERPALFAAQFSLSHACWLVTYPVAGAVGVAIGIERVALLLAAVAALAALAARALWPAPRGHGRFAARRELGRSLKQPWVDRAPLQRRRAGAPALVVAGDERRLSRPAR